MGRGFKKFGIKAGKFVGSAVLNKMGLTSGSSFKLTDEVKEDLAEVVATGVYAALQEHMKDNPE